MMRAITAYSGSAKKSAAITMPIPMRIGINTITQHPPIGSSFHLLRAV